MAEIVTMLLQADGYRADFALTGKTGIALATRSEAHAVLLDYMLPDMTGGEVGIQLRLHPAMKGLKIFMCTSTSEGVVSPIFNDYDGFFRKPTNHTRLIQALDDALAGL